VRKVVETYDGGSEQWEVTATRKFVWSGWRMLLEFNELEGHDRVLRKYTWGLDLAGLNGGVGQSSTLSSLERAGGTLDNPVGRQGRVFGLLAMEAPQTAGGFGGLLRLGLAMLVFQPRAARARRFSSQSGTFTRRGAAICIPGGAAPPIEAATAQPTRQSSQWLSIPAARGFHSSSFRPRPSVRTRYSLTRWSASSRLRSGARGVYRWVDRG
jgi:hypothetical protein